LGSFSASGSRNSLFFLFTGLGARLRRRCENICGGRWFWTVTLLVCAYLVLAALIVLPFSFYVYYVLPHAAGYSNQTLPNWLKGEGVQLAVKLIVAALLIWIPYRLIAKSPRRWWLYCALALIPFAFLALVALPVWVAPLTTSYKPLDDHPLEAEIKSLAARCGAASLPVFVGGNDTTVVGLGPTNRIVLQSNLAQVETPDQIEFTVGHELKHYVMGDNWKALAIIVAILLGGFWFTDRLGRAAIHRFSQRWGFSELSDPAPFPLIVFMFTFIWLAILPFFNLFARHIELEADRFGLELTHQNHAASMIFAKDAETGLPPVWDTFFLITQATHPSIAVRIEFANDYKPWEKGAPLATAMSANLSEQSWISYRANSALLSGTLRLRPGDARGTPDGKTIYFVSGRGAVFDVWGVHFDPAQGKPVAESFPVSAFGGHGPMIARWIPLVELSLTENELVLNMAEVSDGIWVLDNVDR
jgi:Zn-dependent protease with chaperone function